MMLKNLIKHSSIALALCVSANSFAGIITDTVSQNEKVQPTSCGWFCSVNGSYSYTHNILDDGFVLGSAIGGNLSINIYDDGDFFSRETASISIENLDLGTGGNWGGSFGSVSAGWAQDLQVNALVALNTDGFLDVTISGSGDFYVGDSVLTVTTQDIDPVITTPATNVSEPTTFALFGLGLLGLGISRKKLSA